MDIKVERLTKVYVDKAVVDIDSLTIDKGNIYGIIGPNGAGKSTMIRIIAGLEEATNGKISYNGRSLDAEYSKNITYMKQRPYLFRTSVFNNIAYPLKIRKYDKKTIERRVNDIMEEFKVSDLRGQLATSLSGGESQKVSLARALVFEPKILLLDEPTANIDPNSIELIEKIISKRNKEKKMTTIIITHNIGQAKRLCHRVIFMREGKIVEYGSADQVILAPQNNATKRFLSIYSMWHQFFYFKKK